MARACAALEIPLVHISTDYVFAGDGERARQPKNAPAPQNAYGRTKLAGEEGVRAAGGPRAILRTSWVFSAHGSNFLRTMLHLSETCDALSVVADQIGGPTPASANAAACLSIAGQLGGDASKSGTYHLSGVPDVSWHDFTAEIFAVAGRKIALTPIPTSAYPAPAKRLLNSRLDCRATKEVFAIPRPEWRAAVADILKELEINA